PSSAPPAPRSMSPTQELIAFLLDVVAEDPADGLAQRDLGLALLQRIRETADPSLYPRADEALAAARARLPDDPLVLVGIGGLQLGRHEFAAALEAGQAAVDAFAGYPPARGVVVDALVELGRYDEAFAAAEALAADAPDLASLARLSYARELRGDLAGALAAMEEAAASPGLAAENSAYILALVGHLRTLSGDAAGAATAYEDALALVPDHAPSLAGQARLAVGRGDLSEAQRLFERAAGIVPLPEYVIALGETLEARGDDAGARDQYELAGVLIELFRANGGVVDVDLALFEADHGDAAMALELAQAGYAATPTIRAADAVAWALHRLGRDPQAAPYAAEALRLGSRDPLLRYHAGAIAAALGQTEAARRDLQAALDADPGFSPLGAVDARALLVSLGG
ncbi:MAG: tetratricopeptide repeat protein, partial [Candidatus Limnocylindrales bacterium]